MKRLTVLLIAMVLLLLGCRTAPHSFSDADTENRTTTSTTTTSNTSQTTKQNTTDVLSITLYHKEDMFRGEAKEIKTLENAAQIESICGQLSAASWQSHEGENWVKCLPKYASHILVFKQKDKQTVLHIPYADDKYIAVGTFDSNLSYAEIFQIADADQKNGVERFTRYTVDETLTTYLCALF